MWPYLAVEREPFRQPVRQFRHGGIVVHVHAFLFSPCVIIVAA
jgi:hypothetical protein